VTKPDTTYRELVDGAYSAAARASAAMLQHRFTNTNQAGQSVAAYRDLLDAVHTHIRYLLPQARTRALEPPSVEPTAMPTASLLAHAASLLTERGRRSPAPPDLAALPEQVKHWRQAATKLRAAHDLLDTHRGPDFGWRTPDAWLLDHPQPQAAAAEDLAGLLRTIAGAGQTLALRAREIDANIDCADILNPATLRLAAASLTHHAHSGNPIPAFDEVSPAHAASRPHTDREPLRAATQAMAELRQRAWEHARSPHVSIRTISIYALLAITVHQHAAAITIAAAAQDTHLGSDRRGPAAVARLQRSSQLSSAAAAAWRDVYGFCSGLQATTPTHADAYEQLLTVRGALDTVTRSGDRWRPPAEILPSAAATHQLLTAIRQLVTPLDEISAWNKAAVGRLIEANQLYIPAADLDRAQISDDPILAAAHLNRKAVPLPRRQTSELLDAFAIADGATWEAVQAHDAANTFGQPARPALLTMRAMHRAAGRPAIGL